MANINLWVWKQIGKKKEQFCFEKFMGVTEFKEWLFNLVLELEENQSFEIKELPVMNEGFEAIKITLKF